LRYLFIDEHHNFMTDRPIQCDVRTPQGPHMTLLTFRNDSAEINIFGWGGGTGGGTMTLKFELVQDLATMHLPIKFRHPKFTRSEVIVFTNKQTNIQRHAAENIQRSSLRCAIV